MICHPRKACVLNAVSGPEVPIIVSDCEQPAKAVMPIAIRGCAIRNNRGEFIPFNDSSVIIDTLTVLHNASIFRLAQ